MYEALCVEGYVGTVDTVRPHMRVVERRLIPIATAFIPQNFAAGEAYQFDWGHEHVELGGLDQLVKVAHVRLRAADHIQASDGSDFQRTPRSRNTSMPSGL